MYCHYNGGLSALEVLFISIRRKNFIQHSKGSLRWQEEIARMLTPLLSAEQSLTSPDTAGDLARGCYLFQCVEHIVFRKGGESALY